MNIHISISILKTMEAARNITLECSIRRAAALSSPSSFSSVQRSIIQPVTKAGTRLRRQLRRNIEWKPKTFFRIIANQKYKGGLSA